MSCDRRSTLHRFWLPTSEGKAMSLRTNSDSQKFTRDIIWVGLSQLLTSLLGIVTMPALTKNYTTEMYGIWVQVSVTVGLVAPLLTLQLGSAAVRFLAGEDDKKKRRKALGSMLSAIVIFGCLVFASASLFLNQFSVVLFNTPKLGNYVCLTLLWIFLDALFAFSIAYLRARGNMIGLSIRQGALALAKMVTIVTLTAAGYGLDLVITGLIAVDAAFTLVLFAFIIKELGLLMPNFAGLKSFLAFSLPQVPSGVLLWIISASDRYFITHILDLSQTGIYSSSRALGGLIAIFLGPIGFVLFPSISKLWEQGRQPAVKSYLEYSTKLFLTMAIPSSIGLFILSQPLLKLLTTSEFLVGGWLVLLIALSTIFLGIYQINVYIVLLVKQTKWLPLMILAASATSAGVNMVLIPRIGILGAAISSIAAYFLLAVIVSVWARKAVAYNIDFKYLGKVMAAALVMGSGMRFMQVDSVFSIILAVLAGLLLFGCALLLMRAFSGQDKRLIRQTLAMLIPILNQKKT